MAYIKFKELTKYFNFNKKIEIGELPKYVLDYVLENENIIAAYRTSRDRAVFTDKRMILFDRDPLAVHYKKIHMFPYSSISSSAINYKPGKVELLFSFDSGYQLHINFIDMHHEQKEIIKAVYKKMMNYKIEH